MSRREARALLEANPLRQKSLLVTDTCGFHTSDSKHCLAAAALPSTMVLSFDSRLDSAQVLVEKIRGAHFANGRPFEAIGFANHGGAMWRLAADCEVEMGSPTFLFDVQAVMSAMVAALSQSGRKADNRIDLLGCDLLYHDPLMVVKLQDFYGVNFTASTDKTGNPQAGGDWVMESDGVDITHSYFDLHKLKRFAETLSLKTSLSALQDKVMDYVPIVGTVLRNAAEGAVDLAIKKAPAIINFALGEAVEVLEGAIQYGSQERASRETEMPFQS